MHKLTYKFISLLSVLVLVLHVALPVGANVPPKRFDFIPIAYTGEILDALPCSEGLFSVKNEQFCSGFIAADGTLQIPFEFAYAGAFHNELAPAAVSGGKYGYIGKDGLFAIAPAFNSADDFSNGLARVEKDTTAFYIDDTGKQVTYAALADYTPVGAFKDDVCWLNTKDGAYRLLDADNQFVTPQHYHWAAEFSDGVAWVSTQPGDSFLDYEVQLIDTAGNVLIPGGKYKSASAFKEGVCWAKRCTDDTLVLINKSGEALLTAPDTEGIPTPYANGLSIGLENNLFTVRNMEGVVIFSSLNYRAVSYGGFSEGKLLVQDLRDGKYYIMHDTYYVPENTKTASYRYPYQKPTPTDTDFEIVLRINSPLALVNGEKTYIDAANHDVKAFVQNGRTLAPMRFLSEHLPGWSITWDYLTESALLQSDSVVVNFREGKSDLNYIRYNTQKRSYDTLDKHLDQPPIISDGRMFLPVRALSELMEVNVFYDTRGLVVFSNTRTALTHEAASALLEQLE